MLLQIENIITADDTATLLSRLREAQWDDGRVTAGYQSAQAKRNTQVAEDDPIARALGDALVERLLANPTFFAAALPLRIYPPLFNRYEGGQAFGMHVDNAIRYDRRHTPPLAVRTDLSATLFLNDPESYDGGELIVEDTYGTHAIKLPAGHMVLYPGSSLHRVAPVTRGARTACFFWVQSMVPDAMRRRLLFDMDLSIQELASKGADAGAVLRLTGVYHNLLREWSIT
ncbi:Fe2+-dependent dioxygenase [Luteibacter aegosomatissinici]|uniref:Fe2+-dependent dioxygenase n=1 Tax=Luteibacter aegosomatissinici TaxID=2911539 RepID=UPI001FF806B7|nr:Fe2+-dependent dioxygenase [Luteibacter aegosomatissinici]UPG96287.1 Fe2+-dependent dioxygenase [Luteibacter aegosomatissinici]